MVVVVELDGEHWPSQVPSESRQSGFEDLDCAGHRVCAGGGVRDVFALVMIEELLCFLISRAEAVDVQPCAEFLVKACRSSSLRWLWRFPRKSNYGQTLEDHPVVSCIRDFGTCFSRVGSYEAEHCLLVRGRDQAW